MAMMNSKSLLLLTLAIAAITIGCTSATRLGQTTSLSTTSIANSSKTEEPDVVPEWFEDCVLYWVNIDGRHFGEVLIDRKPFTWFCGLNRSCEYRDERVDRCWHFDKDALVYTAYALAYTNGDFSPLLLRALKNLVAKRHIKPFSHFEVTSRIYEIGRRPRDPLKPKSSMYRHYYLEFKEGMKPGCTDDLPPCDDYSCDQNSLEYWCHFFRVQEAGHQRRLSTSTL